jgi:hypothetical protein
MTVDSSGAVFINNLGTLTGKSDVQYDTSTKELGYVTSSKRYKKNIRNKVDSSWLYKIDVKTYDRKDGSHDNEVGLIAEDVAKFRPDICSPDMDGKVATYSNTAIVPFLIKEIQNLKKEIETLKGELNG